MEELLNMLPTVALGMVLGGFLLLWWNHWSPSWRVVSKSGDRLPKGSFGWPIIGESIEFALDHAAYLSSHFKRYGSIFMSSLSFQHVIIGTSPEFAKFVTSNSNLFVSRGTVHARELLGENSFMFKDGAPHLSVKKLLQKVFQPESLRSRVNALENIICDNMSSWEQKGTVLGRHEAEEIMLEAAIWLILGIRESERPELAKEKENLKLLSSALGSLPLNIPGTTYNKGLKASAALRKYFKSLIEQRKGEENNQTDILGVLLAARENPQAREVTRDLDDDTMVDNLVVMLFSAYDTTAITLTWTLKFLVDHPKVFNRVQAEQQEILKTKDQKIEGPRLSWDDTRKMAYTHKFFQELQRTVSIAPSVARQATQDIEFEGHVIPKGWGVWPTYKVIHSDPAIYSDPESFNPDRFDTPPKPYTYLPFSVGPHMCPGIEFAKLTTLIFIHHLTTTFEYESAAPESGVKYRLFPIPKGGYPINIRRSNVKGTSQNNLK